MRATPRLFKLTSLASLCAFALPALATNGMNMEGYGPVSTAMGGASQALDHGTAAMAQNPATLGLMAPGARLDAAFGVLGPDVASSVPGATAKSGGTSYVMPAFGYARRSGSLTYGVGMFAQGGMGTEYDGNAFFTAGGSGRETRSELGVGRLLLPLAWEVAPNFIVGGSIDFVWANLDLRMELPGSRLASLVTGVPSGGLASQLGPLSGSPWVRIDFSDDNDFSGAARSTGWAFKLGAVWKASPSFTLGASYQGKTTLDDMKTGTTGAAMSGPGGFGDAGRITVLDFQWPTLLAIGGAWQATPALLVAADVKRIGWSDVMESFKMRYDSAGFGGSVTFALPQQWKDQTVVNLGVAYALNQQFTLRAGYNHADNPIPEAFVNPLFPATVENHYTLGLGWQIAPRHAVNASLTVAPESSVTNGDGIVVTHKQTNVQVMYSFRF